MVAFSGSPLGPRPGQEGAVRLVWKGPCGPGTKDSQRQIPGPSQDSLSHPAREWPGSDADCSP